MTCYRGFLLGSCRRVAGGRAAALRVPGAGGPGARPRLGGDGGARRRLGQGQGQARELAGCGRRPDGGFRPSRVVVVAKTTRYEFEQQRYRYAELSEEDLKQLVGPGARPPPGRPRRCARPARGPTPSGFAPRPPPHLWGAWGGRERDRGGGHCSCRDPGAGRSVPWKPGVGAGGSAVEGFGAHLDAPPLHWEQSSSPRGGLALGCRPGALQRAPQPSPAPRESGVRAAARGRRRGHTPWASAGPSGRSRPVSGSLFLAAAGRSGPVPADGFESTRGCGAGKSREET